ncbi:MAG: aromatic amino acid transport family protein [Calothrix sp. MO_167.B42]|nr:aromatic amino acid transport family protein [Calothrix sp. MO_167.B42]
MKTAIKPHTPPNRLFSHVQLHENQLSHQPGSIWGSIALVAGTTVGAGILALPAVTLPSGVVPSTTLLIGVWVYTLVSGLLLAEVTLNTMRASGNPNNNLLLMVANTLGKPVAIIAAVAYLFMHYALLIAYIAEGGEIIASVLSQWSAGNIPVWVGSITFTLIFGGMMYVGKDKLLAKINGILVAIVITSFIGLLFLGATQVHPEQLQFRDWTALSPAISVMLVAMFYHNIVPVVVNQLEGDGFKIRQAIIIGSLIPLIMFLAWNGVILGSVSYEKLQGVSDPLILLRQGNGGEWLGVLLSIFSEFAIATSFIGFMYGLIDFFRDIFQRVSSKQSDGRLPLIYLAILPSLSLSTLQPGIFFTALDYAGTYSISVLGGILPALMSWQQRKVLIVNQSLVPGGKITLITMIAITLLIIFRQLLTY